MHDWMHLDAFFVSSIVKERKRKFLHKFTLTKNSLDLLDQFIRT